MRATLLGLLVLAAAPRLSAQQAVSVPVQLQVTIPEFLSVRVGDAQDIARPDGHRVRRFTVYVTANRSWDLRIVRGGVVVSAGSGRAGNDLPVVVEVAWGGSQGPPDPAKLDYLLTGD